MANYLPKCRICSYRQAPPATPIPLYHRHDSSRQVRIFQGVEYATNHPDYLCPTCQVMHGTRLQYGLNICVSTSQLHGFHQPRQPGVTCPPDTSHVDWLTIPGATIADLLFAWRLDYHREPHPMRVLLVAGLNDLLKGGDFQSVREQIKRFKINIDYQNRYHPGLHNQFSVATLLNPPKMCWLPDNGPVPAGHSDRSDDITLINDWIDAFNSLSQRQCVPRFNTWGTRTTSRMVNGVEREFKTHRWNEWRSSEPRNDMLHLSDKMRVKMGRHVIRYFEGEFQRDGPIRYG